MHGKNLKYRECFVGKCTVKNHLEYLDVDGKMILK
jgi:hypothetical protein